MIYSHSKDTINLSNASKLQSELPNLLLRDDLAMQVRGDTVFIYKSKYSQYHGKKRDKISDENLKKRKYQGQLSPSARKHISKQLSTWSDCISLFNQKSIGTYKRRQTYLTFLTLQLPARQVHSDQEIKRRLLVPYIQYLKGYYDLNNYFWRAEKQRNGNVHFHLILDIYIKYDELRRLWLQALNTLGYIDAYQRKHGNRSPYPLSVSGIDNIKNAVRYTVKYATKADNNGNIGGKIWGMSDNLRQLKPFTTDDKKAILMLYLLLIEQPGTRVRECDHCLIVSTRNSLSSLRQENAVASQYVLYLQLIYFLLYRDRHKDDPNYTYSTTFALPGLDSRMIDALY